MINFKNTCLIFFCLFLFSSYGQEKKLTILGNDQLETSVIKKLEYKKTHLNIEDIKLEVKNFQRKLTMEGYINCELLSLDSTSLSQYEAKFYIKNKIEFIHIYIGNYFNDVTWQSIIKKEIKNDTLILPYSNIEITLDNLTKKLSSKGYPFLSLSLKNISSIDSNTLKANLKIDHTESKRILNKIVINGYDKFPESYIKHYLKIKTNRIFDIETIRKKTKALRNLGFSNQIKEPEILFTKDSTLLYLYLEKTKSNTFDGFIGFTTNENTNNLEFNGYLDVVLTNNLNYGESLSINYKSDESDQTNFNIETHLPYLFKSPLGLNAALYISKIDSTFSNTSQKLNLTYQLDSKNSFLVGIEGNTSSDLLNDSNNNIQNYNSNFINIGYQLISRQPEDLLFPIKTNISLSTGFGSRKSNLIDSNQKKLSLTASHIFNLNYNNSLYFRGITNLLLSNTYLENELYRFGGFNTIRGFSENSIIASNLYLLNTEYRYRLSESIFVNSVLDIGHFKNNIFNTKENIYGFGFGFGILTKTGLLRFIYANGKNENSPFKLNNSKIHLKITAIF